MLQNVIIDNIYGTLTPTETALLNAEMNAYNPNLPAWDEMDYDEMWEALNWLGKLRYTDTNGRFVTDEKNLFRDPLHSLHKKIIEGACFEGWFVKGDLSFPIEGVVEKMFRDLQTWSADPADRRYNEEFAKIIAFVAKDLGVKTPLGWWMAGHEIMRKLPNEDYIMMMWYFVKGSVKA